ncbi:MAG: NADH-quinone oxidoreductase subunit N [Candidatus Zixiibacteriota bacterium]|nr:MAG: NADH-quinone oxidoreductase subunit N [candidate division Zixibacteria bacterium]
MEWQLPEYNLRMMLPEIFLFLWALAVMTFDLFTKRKTGSAVGYLSLLGLLITGFILSLTGYGRGFTTMFFNDPMSLFFKIIFLGAAFMAIASSFGITKQKIVNHRGEYFGLILLSTVGMMFLSSSNELLSLYIGLELTTIPLFVLAAFFKDDKLSVEAGIKYFVVGAFSSALLLYGLSFLYGLSGTTDIVQMKINLAITHLTFKNIGLILSLAVVLLVAGIGFKLALPPFHQWAPDVYEGSPTPIAAFLSVGSKAAGLVAFAKIFLNGLSAFHGPEMAPNDWGKLVGLLACLALIIGNVLAIRQSNIKRMLAYSSIAHVGYIMIGMVAMNELGIASVGFYLFAYLFANMGAFGVVAIFEDKSGSCQIASYAGLSKTSPFLSISMTVFLLSLVGIPPLAGFLAKYYVFAAAIKVASSDPAFSWMYWLVGIGLLTAVFSLYYYANVIKEMYFSAELSPYRISFSAPAMSVLLIGLIGVFLFGLYPEPILQFASKMSLVFGFVQY